MAKASQLARKANEKLDVVIRLLKDIEGYGVDVDVYLKLLFPSRKHTTYSGVLKPTPINILRLQKVLEYVKTKQNLSEHERKKHRGRKVKSVEGKGDTSFGEVET
jgi:hypothetical protein